LTGKKINRGIEFLVYPRCASECCFKKKKTIFRGNDLFKELQFIFYHEKPIFGTISFLFASDLFTFLTNFHE